MFRTRPAVSRNGNPTVRITDDCALRMNSKTGTSPRTKSLASNESSDRRPHAPRSVSYRDLNRDRLHEELNSVIESLISTTHAAQAANYPSPMATLYAKIRTSHEDLVVCVRPTHDADSRHQTLRRVRTTHPNGRLTPSLFRAKGTGEAPSRRAPRSSQLSSKSRVYSPQAKPIAATTSRSGRDTSSRYRAQTKAN